MDGIDEELYFLILRFLQAGPCKAAANALKSEIVQHELLPKRCDWEGRRYPRAFEELISTHPHIGSDHLKRICSRLPALLDEKYPPSVPGVLSLLGAGSQSMLRSSDKNTGVILSPSSYLARQHGVLPKLPVSLVHKPTTVQRILGSQQTGAVPNASALSSCMYKHYGLQRRFLGHLSSVYCVLYDKTGQYIFTGADDNLVKVWSALSGRLLATLRGHSGEITDMDVNYENEILATGSCDKTIRIWCLKTTVCLSILHGHTSLITSVKFCPMVKNDTRYLASTGEDGNVCFWYYYTDTLVFEKKPLKFCERSRAGTRMLCSSFSPGGLFLATGNSDNDIRVYCLMGATPEKIGELGAHYDVVDSIQYSNHGDRFVSGSPDGTARIWRHMRNEWLNLVLDMSSSISSNSGKLKVNMVGWTPDDSKVLTALIDCTIRIWCSYSGKLLGTLKGHEADVYAFECSPLDDRLLLTGGHDGHVKLWDIDSCTELMDYYNMIDGQGYGAVFDCKWSPLGYTFAATDSHGHLMHFGPGKNEKLGEDKIPTELYFHTDYRTLIRDANDHVLDEQTQRAVHLLPPPFLVDIDGIPYPPVFQRLVPGRELLPEQNLIPVILDMPNGSREVQDQELPEQSATEAQQSETRGDGQSSSQENDSLQNTGQSEQENSNQRGCNQPTVGANPIQSDGRQLSTSTGGFAAPLASSQRTRCMIKDMDKQLIDVMQKKRMIVTEHERSQFISEVRKRPFRDDEHLESSNGEGDAVYQRTRRKKLLQSYRTRSTRRQEARQTGEQAVRNRLTTRALYDTDYEEEEAEDDEVDVRSVASGREAASYQDNSSTEEDSDTSVAHPLRLSHSDESSDYSDWERDNKSNLQPPSRRMTRRVVPPCSLSPNNSSSERASRKQKIEQTSLNSGRTKRAKKRAKRVVAQLDASINDGSEIDLEKVRAPDWLTTDTPRKSPYFPQMGDEVIYFHQGHKAYIEEVKKQGIYNIPLNRSSPWSNIPNLRDQELVRVVGIKFEVKAPGVRLCCLKLDRINSGIVPGTSFQLKYHDMPGVIDFLVLRQHFDKACQRDWSVGDRFRSIIDDQWWAGTVREHIPYDPDYPDCQFQCLKVEWDGGGEENMSPWDLEPLPESEDQYESRITAEELKSLQYVPDESEWPDGGRDKECDRISACLEQAMGYSKAEAFTAPVDLNSFPIYALSIAYPIDLSTIKSRLDNRFYRRVAAVQFDVRHIESNAEEFNQPGSSIIVNARIVTEMILNIISDTNCYDAQTVYSCMDLEDDYFAESSPKPSSSTSPKKKGQVEKYDWKPACSKLLNEVMQMEDSVPFREPVDDLEYPEYKRFVEVPMDFSTIIENHACGEFETPQELLKDIQTIFSNSKKFNTNKKSKVIGMTVRLSAKVTEEMQVIMRAYKNSLLKERSESPPARNRRSQKSNRNISKRGACSFSTESLTGSPVRQSSRLQLLRQQDDMLFNNNRYNDRATSTSQNSSLRTSRRLRTRYLSDIANLSSSHADPSSFLRIQKKSRLRRMSGSAEEYQSTEEEEESSLTRGKQMIGSRTRCHVIPSLSDEDNNAEAELSDYEKETDEENANNEKSVETEGAEDLDSSASLENYNSLQTHSKRGKKRKLQSNHKSKKAKRLQKCAAIRKTTRSDNHQNGWSRSRFRTRTGASNYREADSDSEEETTAVHNELIPIDPLLQISSRGRLRKPTSKAVESWR